MRKSAVKVDNDSQMSADLAVSKFLADKCRQTEVEIAKRKSLDRTNSAENNNIKANFAK